nr:MAG TPA: hypothetical protein [Caudoviricetes sp.]
MGINPKRRGRVPSPLFYFHLLGHLTRSNRVATCKEFQRLLAQIKGISPRFYGPLAKIHVFSGHFALQFLYLM